MSKFIDTLKVASDELIHKVTWPSWEELRSSTWIVLIASIMFALVIYVMDFGFKAITDFVYEIVG
jgi:preprotein translocase subunit SecE